MVGPEPWKRYEAQIAEEFRLLAKNAEVSVNEVFIGRRSKAKRKVEIVVRGEFPGFGKAVMLVDCKLWNKSIGVQEVGEFYTQLDDIGAELGMLVTTVEATEGAISLAKSYRGVRLLVRKFNEEREEFEPPFILCDCEWGCVYLDGPMHRDVDGIGRCDHCSTLWAVCSCGASIDFNDGRPRRKWWPCDGACGREWFIEPSDPRDGADEQVLYRDNGGEELELMHGPDSEG